MPPDRHLEGTQTMTITADFLPSLPAATGADRRRYTRVQVRQPLPALIGRGSGTLVDLSVNGARIRHASPVQRGARVRVTFEWRGQRFEANAEVLASRVASLGGHTQFESRLRFVTVSESSHEVLERTLTELLDRDLRKWVANLHGWNEEPLHEEAAISRGGYIRCIYTGGRWQQTPTRDAMPPAAGFTVPEGTSPAEIRTLCHTWESADEDGRRLVRLITDAVVKQQSHEIS